MNAKSFLLAALSTLMVAILPQHPSAHPHVYVANRFTVLFDDHGMTAIRVNWVFDKFFSTMILEEYDQNHNNVLEVTEVANIKKNAFSNLAKSGYFMHVKIDGQPFEVKFVCDFAARIRDGALIYEFTIPCHVRAVAQPKQIRAAPYDPSFYTLILFAETKAVNIKGDAKFKVNYKIKKNAQEAYYHGFVHPYEMILEFSLKNG